MNKHLKAILILTVAQVACLACGLWVRDRFLLATVQWQASKQGAAAGRVSDRYRDQRTTDQRTTDQRTTHQGAADQGAADQGGADQRGADRSSRAGPSIAPTRTAAPVAGLEQVRAAMPLVMILTLVWIGGLQFLAAYLVLTRLLSESSRNQEQSQLRLLSREKELVRTRNAVIFGLAKLAEYRDRETGQHLERIALLATCLATALRRDPRFRDAISLAFVKTIGISSVLHDIGKVGLPDSILHKEGPLTAVERKRMESHTAIGAECIRQIEQRLGDCNFLQMAGQIAIGHHERWDGSGYPNGISGSEIPLAARVVAIVDVYDALVSKRCYKDAMPHQQCVAIIAAAAGSHLDPALVEVFRSIEPQFWEIASRYADRTPVGKKPPQRKYRPSDLQKNDRLMASILDFGDVASFAAAT